MKIFSLLLICFIALVGVFLLVSGPDSNGAASMTPALEVVSLDDFAASASFPIGRYPGMIDANQSEPIVAAVAGLVTFREEAFAGALREGDVVAVFESQLEMKTTERMFLASEFDRLTNRIELMGDLERERSLRQTADRVEELREQVRILRAIEENPELEGGLLQMSDIGFRAGVDNLESGLIALRLLEAEYELLSGDDDVSNRKRSFEVQSALANLDTLIDSLSAKMPFNGSFSPSFPSEVVGRAIPVRTGDVLGIASDDSGISLSVVSTDPELALIDGSELFARIRVGGREVEGAFIRRERVLLQDRPVPLYRFQFSGDVPEMQDLIGSQISAVVVRKSPSSVVRVPKLRLVQAAINQGVNPSTDWAELSAAVFPEATLFAETKADVILKPNAP